jgi:hypothetical protein
MATWTRLGRGLSLLLSGRWTDLCMTFTPTVLAFSGQDLCMTFTPQRGPAQNGSARLVPETMINSEHDQLRP